MAIPIWDNPQISGRRWRLFHLGRATNLISPETHIAVKASILAVCREAMGEIAAFPALCRLTTHLHSTGKRLSPSLAAAPERYKSGCDLSQNLDLGHPIPFGFLFRNAEWMVRCRD
jgi:hypothetical protein